jgi:hypothetical protein
MLTDKQTIFKNSHSSSPNEGLVKVEFEITAEAYEKIAGLAQQNDKSLSEVASILLTTKVVEHKKIEECVERAISKAFDEENTKLEEELIRINAPTEKFNRLMLEIFPHLKSKLEKKESN